MKGRTFGSALSRVPAKRQAAMSVEGCTLAAMTRPPLRVVVLGSGSSGNATAVADGTTTLLIDCGFSARETARRMAAAGLDPATVSAVLVTHEHSDHVRGIEVFTRRHASACRVMSTRGTLAAEPLDAVADRAEALRPGEVRRIGTLDVVAFRTSHDAADPVGYRIEAGGAVVGIATDTGVLTDEAREALAGCDVLAIECNHDLDMLENGPYPYFLKRRIRSSRGHLSNPDAADAVEALASDRLRRVIAMHRSRTNNTHGLAGRALEARLARIGLGVPVDVARQDGVVDPEPAQGSLFEGPG